MFWVCNLNQEQAIYCNFDIMLYEAPASLICYEVIWQGWGSNSLYLYYLDINNVFGFPLIRCLDIM